MIYFKKRAQRLSLNVQMGKDVVKHLSPFVTEFLETTFQIERE